MAGVVVTVLAVAVVVVFCSFTCPRDVASIVLKQSLSGLNDEA